MSDATIPNYRLHEELPDFGPGRWYRAEDLRNGGSVALGILNEPPHLTSPQQRTFGEHILPILDDGISPQGGSYLVTSLSNGTTLEARLRHRSLRVSESLAIAHKIATALFELHRAGQTYGRLDPEVVQLSASDDVRLFPPGTHISANMEDPFRAPELAGSGTPTIQADIWGLGVLLYLMVTGAMPFVQKDPIETAYAVRFEEPPPLHTRRRGVPAGLQSIVQLALAKRPEHRYQNLRDLIGDLEAVRERRRPLVATPYRISLATRRTARGMNRRRMPPVVRTGIIALGALLVVGVGYLAIQGPSPWSSLESSGVRIAVLPFLDMTYRPEAPGWPYAVQKHLADELRMRDNLVVMDPDSLNNLLRSRVGSTQARRGRWLFMLMEDLNVDYLVDGGVYVDRQGYVLRGQLIQRWSAEALLSDTEQFHGEQDLEAAADRLGAALRMFLEHETAETGDE